LKNISCDDEQQQKENDFFICRGVPGTCGFFMLAARWLKSNFRGIMQDGGRE